MGCNKLLDRWSYTKLLRQWPPRSDEFCCTSLWCRPWMRDTSILHSDSQSPTVLHPFVGKSSNHELHLSLMQWCSSCHPGMPGADICTSFRWIETLAKVARLFAKACEISESQWSGNKGQFQYQKSKQESIKIIENPCKVATIYYHFENTMTVYGCYLNKHCWTAGPWRVHWSAFDNPQTRIAANGSANGRFGPSSSSFLGKGFHMKIHTWRFIFSCRWMSCCQKKSHKISQICWWFFLDQLNWWFLKNLKLIKFHFEHFFRACKRLRLLVTNSKGSYKYFCSSATISGAGEISEFSMDGFVKISGKLSVKGGKKEDATMENSVQNFHSSNTWKVLRLPPSRHSFHWCLLPSLHLEV